MSRTRGNGFNSFARGLLVRESFGVEYNLVHSPLVCRSKKKHWHIVASPARKKVSYLSADNLHKMIQRFLIEKQMSKKELAGLLAITVKNLDQLFDPVIPPGLLCKINFPLVNLYCSTKWD